MKKSLAISVIFSNLSIFSFSYTAIAMERELNDKHPPKKLQQHNDVNATQFGGAAAAPAAAQFALVPERALTLQQRLALGLDDSKSSKGQHEKISEAAGQPKDKGVVPVANSGQILKFTYLDLIDPSIIFLPVMYGNQVETMVQEGNDPSKPATAYKYSLFATSQPHAPLPGYCGKRCIIEVEMALCLRKIQRTLQQSGPYALKVFDTYRPQQAVSALGEWSRMPEDPIVTRFHHPNVLKAGFNDLTYVARRSSHSKGTAVDLTIATTQENHRDFTTPVRPGGFLGLYSPDELDMGVGYLAFDQSSSHYYSNLTQKQKNNRKRLTDLMFANDFTMHPMEFWHYFYKMDRNKDYFYDFPVRDDYTLTEDGIIVLPPAK